MYLFCGIGLDQFPQLAGLSERLLIFKFKLDDNVGDLLLYGFVGPLTCVYCEIVDGDGKSIKICSVLGDDVTSLFAGAEYASIPSPLNNSKSLLWFLSVGCLRRWSKSFNAGAVGKLKGEPRSTAVNVEVKLVSFGTSGAAFCLLYVLVSL